MIPSEVAVRSLQFTQSHNFTLAGLKTSSPLLRIHPTAQHMSTTSRPLTLIIESRMALDSNARRQSILLRNIQRNMRIPPKTRTKREHQHFIKTFIYCVYITTYNMKIPPSSLQHSQCRMAFSSPIWRPSGFARPVSRVSIRWDFRRHCLSLFSMNI